MNKIIKLAVVCAIIIFLYCFLFCAPQTVIITSSVSVVIPCIPKHVALLYNVLRTIETQTLPPNEVIIALSEASNQKWSELAADLSSRYPSLNIIGTPVEYAANAATNRNRGAKLATSELISFMDADDLMHPHRLQVLVDTFIVYGPHAVLHGWGEIGEKGETPFQDVEAVRAHVASKKPTESPHCEFDRAHHGHFTVKKEVFARVKQDESEETDGREDSEYVSRLVTAGYSVIFIPDILSTYRNYWLRVA